MGQCSAAEAEEENYREVFSTEDIPHKCIILNKPSQILLQYKQETARIPTDHEHSIRFKIDLSYAISDNILITSKNKLLYMQQFTDPNDLSFRTALHHYNVQKSVDIKGLVTAEIPTIISNKESQKKPLLLIESQSLGPDEDKYVEIRDLGLKMKEKGIEWQDRQFDSIIVESLKILSKVYDQGYYGVENIVVGKSGKVYVYAKLSKNQASDLCIKKDCEKAKIILLKALYGVESKDYEKLQQNSVFKHPDSLKKIHNFYKYLSEYVDQESTPIPPSSAKYIKDYINTYFYWQETRTEDLLKGYLTLGQHQRAKQILVENIIIRNHHQSISEDSLKSYEKLSSIEKKINLQSQQCKATQNHTASIAYSLGLQSLRQLKYTKAYELFTKAYQSSSSSLIEDLYIRLFETTFALGRYDETQQYLIEGIKEHIQSEILPLYLIIFYCDSLRIEEGERSLLKYTSRLKSVSFATASARINIVKSLKKSFLFEECIKKAEDQLLRPVFKPTEQKQEVLVLFYETFGDLHLRKNKYHESLRYYEKAKDVLSSMQPSKLKLSVILSAMGNCYMLTKQYQMARNSYKEALLMIKPECQPLTHSIMGNLAILELSQKKKEEGEKLYEKVMNEVSAQKKKEDLNYIFLAEAKQKIAQKQL